MRSFVAGSENSLLDVAVGSLLVGRPSQFNPVVLVGPPGVGKTHVARGLARQWKRRGRPGTVVVTSGAEFARELAGAIESCSVAQMRVRYRTAALLVVDDIAALAKKTAAQQELLFTLDELDRCGGTTVVTSRVGLHEIPRLAPALSSRLSAGLVVTLSPPRPETRQALLVQLARARGIALSDSAARVLAKGLTADVPELLKALVEMSRGKSGIDTTLARQYLQQRSRRKPPDVTVVVASTAKHFSLKTSELKSASRNRSVVMARGIAMYLAREMTGQSLKKIGYRLGRRDHTTVLYNCRKVEKLIRTDPATRQAIDKLKQLLEAA